MQLNRVVKTTVVHLVPPSLLCYLKNSVLDNYLANFVEDLAQRTPQYDLRFSIEWIGRNDLST